MNRHSLTSTRGGFWDMWSMMQSIAMKSGARIQPCLTPDVVWNWPDSFCHDVFERLCSHAVYNEIQEDVRDICSINHCACARATSVRSAWFFFCRIDTRKLYSILGENLYMSQFKKSNITITQCQKKFEFLNCDLCCFISTTTMSPLHCI